MSDPGPPNIRRTVANISRSILGLPEIRPSELPPQAAAAIADLISACDSLIRALAPQAVGDADQQDLLAGVRAHRRLLFLALAAVDPGQADLWTEAYKDAERATEAKIAAGLLARFSSDEGFEAALRARWLGEVDP